MRVLVQQLPGGTKRNVVPGSARERMANPPAGTAPAPLFRLAFRKGALHERGGGNVTDMGTIVKTRVALNATRVNPYTSRTGGLLGSTSFSSIGATPMMPMTAGSLPPRLTPS
jgi:hypothetical protein